MRGRRRRRQEQETQEVCWTHNVICCLALPLMISLIMAEPSTMLLFWQGLCTGSHMAHMFTLPIDRGKT